MYNRYIRTDDGGYTRVPQEEPLHSSNTERKETTQSQNESHPPRPKPAASSEDAGSRFSDGITGFLRQLLDQLHLEHVDTGDLLLLILLFLLFREEADEELLVALGLLLIL